MPEQVTFDPTSEDAANSPLSLIDITTANPVYGIVSHSYPAPPLEVQYAGSVDTEGDAPSSRRYRNRVITIAVEVSTAAGLKALQAKTAKIGREGGTLQRTMPDTTVIVFDLLASTTFDPGFDITYSIAGVATVTLTLDAKPFGRSPEVTLADHVETTASALIFTETSIAGDAPATARLVIDEDQAINQAWVTWGIEQKNYSASANAALYYEAESRTPLGAGAALAVGPAGASGAGSNTILANAVTNSYQAIMSTQAASGGAHLSHVGRFRVFARVYATTPFASNMKIALEWAQGDFRSPTRNADYPLVPYPASGQFTGAYRGIWLFADLGLVSLTATTTGTQQWEGRILASTLVGPDSIWVDSLTFIPVAERSGTARAVAQTPAPTSFLARDEFNQTSGALSTKVAAVGGTWTGSGSANDFNVESTGHTVTRATVNDFSNGRFEWLSGTNYANVVASVDMSISAKLPTLSYRGLALRVVDSANMLVIGLQGGGAPYAPAISVWTIIAGTFKLVGEYQQAGLESIGVWQTLTVQVAADGLVSAHVGVQGATPVLIPVAYSALLATGGTLATGQAGLWDLHASSPTVTRSYDNFRVWTPATDAAMFASRSLEVRADRVVRQNSTGTVWQQPSKYEGDYILMPPSGAEGRTTRVIVKATRNDPASSPDSAADDISARVYVTPRWLSVPS